MGDRKHYTTVEVVIVASRNYYPCTKAGEGGRRDEGDPHGRAQDVAPEFPRREGRGGVAEAHSGNPPEFAL